MEWAESCTFGKAGCFSFTRPKLTTGEGGAIVTNDLQMLRSRLPINHGMEVRYHHDIVGHNYRMTNMNAAIWAGSVEKLDRSMSVGQTAIMMYISITLT